MAKEYAYEYSVELSHLELEILAMADPDPGHVLAELRHRVMKTPPSNIERDDIADAHELLRLS